MKRDIWRLMKYWRLLSFRKFLYLPHILSSKEKKALIVLAAIILMSGGIGVTRLFFALTIPVPQVGASYREGSLKEPRTINPLFTSQDIDRDIARLVFSGLLAYNGEGLIDLDLAKQYEMSADGKVYIVTLREAQWHDGKPVTAEDVLFTIRTIQNPLYKSVLRANWQGVSVEAIDQNTVRFTLKSAYTPFIENLTVGILPKHLWEEVSPEQMLLHELNIKPIGSGPYRFSRFKQEKEGLLLWYELIRNPSYHREGPYLKQITFYFFPHEDELLRAFRKGDIDGFGPVAPANLTDLDLKKTRLLSLQMPRIFGLFFNEKKAPALAEKKVRQAIAFSLDTENIAKTGTSGGASLAYSPFPFSPFNGENPFRYDPQRAKTLLEETGWRDTNEDGIREKIVPKKGGATSTLLRITLTTSDWPDLARTAEHVASALREVGIGTTVETRPFSILESDVLRPRNFEILLFGHVYGYETDPFAFWHSSQIKDPGLNITFYANKNVDVLLEEIRKTNDSEEKQKKLRDAARRITADLPAVFLYTQVYLYILPEDLHGVPVKKISLPADRFNDVHQWFRKTKRVFRE